MNPAGCQGNYKTCEDGRLERMHQYLESAAYFKRGNKHIVFDFYGWSPPNKYYHENHDVIIAGVSHDLRGGMLCDGFRRFVS